jgi:hypothetical protein
MVGPIEVPDIYLSAPTQAAMVTALTATGQYMQPDFGLDFGLDFSENTGLDFLYFGGCPDGGSWKLRVLGQLSTPTPLITIEPIEPGNFTKNVGLPEWPPYVTGQLNPAVGIEYIPDSTSAFWVWFSWNSGSPMPNFGALGLTVSTAGPYASHF